MARRKTNKNVVIVALIVLLLLLAVGYAAFSDTLTISGTANAKGTFDLQFENAEIVKAVGVTMLEPEMVVGDDRLGTVVESNVTSAKVSADGNTLNVNVADLAYPGAGVEFSVDIVNKGSISAKVNELTTDGLQGNDIIKIEGLDQITTDHPTIKAGEKCNIHFIVYWTEESTAVLPENGTSVNFSLGIEYTQSDDNEMFDGKASHDGNVVETNPVVPAEQTLAQKITPKDYGKTINYSVTVLGNDGGKHTYSDWKVLYSDGKNVEIIMSDYLPQIGIPQAAIDAGLDLTKNEGFTTYNVYSKESREKLLSGLTNGWDGFAIDGATAVGTPTAEKLMLSYNEKQKSNDETFVEIDYTGLDLENMTQEDIVKYTISDLLYSPHNEEREGCMGYWLASPLKNTDDVLWCIIGGLFYPSGHDFTGYIGTGVRPVVTLPSSVLGEISDTVTISQ